MPLYKEINSVYDFVQEFHDYERKDNFTFDSLEIIYSYFNEMEEKIKLDVIAICCEFQESTPEEIASYHNIDVSEEEDEDISEIVKEYLNEKTIVLGETDSGLIVFQKF